MRRRPRPSSSRAPSGSGGRGRVDSAAMAGAVARGRRAWGGARVGRAGTLDPFARGLLIVLVGKATKAQRRLMELPKRYETIAQLGSKSSTGDTEGEIVATARLPPDPPSL